VTASAARLHFVLVHGWGFNAAIWRDMAGLMPDAELSFVDLGFLAGCRQDAGAWPEHAIAIGHSLGLLWLLHRAATEGSAPFRALVSIQGFDRFCPHVPSSRVAGMRRSLRRDPYRMLEGFWRGCGTEPFAPESALNIERLEEGLGWLLQWDLSETRAKITCPTLALAASDDEVVPAAMTEAIWRSDNIRWSPTGGHVLPLKRPEWCAHHVLDFAHALQP
jgi:pimeloyl-[acyl-carrier protein] methyl ester esterase